MPLSKVMPPKSCSSCPRARDVLMRKSLPSKGCRSLELNAQQRNQNRYAHGEAWGMRGKPRASMHGQHEARMMERTSSERSASGPAMRPLVPPIDDVLAPSLQQSTNQPFFYCYLSKRWCTYRRRQSPDANAATRPLYYAPHWLLSTWWSRYRRSSRNQLVRPVPPPPVTFTTIEGKRPLLC